MRSVQTRAMLSTCGSKAVLAAGAMNKDSAPSLETSGQRGQRSLHLRGKPCDSAVHDTHDGGMMHDMAIGMRCCVCVCAQKA